jgi:malate dehydrogenase (oxaloacetate-decarboxylating)
VTYQGVAYQIGQANNALVYPGIGLGTIVSGATHVTDGMLLAASQAIAGLVDVDAPGAGVLPDVQSLRDVSATVAVAVARQAAEDGVAPDLDDPAKAVRKAMWQATYRPVEVR